MTDNRGQVMGQIDSEPAATYEGVSLASLIGLERLQHLQDQFSAGTGLASLITFPDGTPITAPSGFCDMCSIIRATDEGARNCMHSDAHQQADMLDAASTSVCASGGLFDAAAPIVVGGRHIATWLAGQVRDESRAEDSVREYAASIGVDEQELVEAFRRVPVMSRERFTAITNMLFTLANELSNIAYQNLLQANLIQQNRVNIALYEGRMSLLELSYTKPYPDVLQAALDLIAEKVESPLGFFDIVERGTNRARTRVWSSKMPVQLTEGQGDAHRDLSEVGIWADAIRLGAPVIHNDYEAVTEKRGLPEGHPPIVRDLVIPIMRDGAVVAAIGVGNKPSNYTEADVHAVRYLADVAWEICRRAEAEYRLRLSEARVRMTLEAVSAGLWEWDTVTDERRWSKEFWLLHGMEPQEGTSTRELWAKVIHPEDREGVLRLIDDAVERHEVFEAEWRVVLPDGAERWLMSRGTPVFDDEGQLRTYLGLVLDISQQRQAQEEILDLNSKLRALALETMAVEERQRRMLSVELHDRVRQPLAVAKIGLQAALADTVGDGERRALKQAISLLTEALSESRSLTSELSPVILYDLGLEAALEWLVEQSARYGLTGSVEPGEPIGKVDSNLELLIFQCVRELIANVAKHAGNPEYILSWAAHPHCVIVTVADNGRGISQEAIDEMLRDKGTFGLFSIRERLGQVGGRLDIHSIAEKGTFVQVTVPRSVEFSGC